MRIDRRGIAAVEFAIIAPVFALTLIGVTDLAVAYNARLKISSTVSAASYFAFQKGQAINASNVTEYVRSISSIIGTQLSGLGAGLDISVLFNNAPPGPAASHYYCVSGFPPNFGGQSASSVDCGGNVTSGKFVSISVTGQIVPMFVSAGLFGSYLTVAETAIVRVN